MKWNTNLQYKSNFTTSNNVKFTYINPLKKDDKNKNGYERTIENSLNGSDVNSSPSLDRNPNSEKKQENKVSMNYYQPRVESSHNRSNSFSNFTALNEKPKSNLHLYKEMLPINGIIEERMKDSHS